MQLPRDQLRAILATTPMHLSKFGDVDSYFLRSPAQCMEAPTKTVDTVDTVIYITKSTPVTDWCSYRIWYHTIDEQTYHNVSCV